MPATSSDGNIGLPARQTFNQGSVDACFSCAIATALEARGLGVPELSAAFHLYYAYGGSPAEGGMTLSRAQAVLTSNGICRQSRYNYDVAAGTPAEGPSMDAIADARPRRTLSDDEGEWMFRRLAGVHRPREWQQALAGSLPVLIRIWLNPGYWAMRSVADSPTWTDTSTPGADSHAVAVLGYEPAGGRFIVQDSRGKDFANQGQWFLPESQATLGPIQDAYVLTVPLANLL